MSKTTEKNRSKLEAPAQEAAKQRGTVKQQDISLSFDAVIVGGGLAGLSMAAALGASGIRAACLERDRFSAHLSPVFDCRTTAIAFGAKQVLAATGVWPYLAPAACPIDQIRVTEGQSRFFLDFAEAERPNGEPFGYIVQNKPMREALLRRVRELKDISLLEGAEVSAVEYGAANVTVTLSDGRHLTTPLLIAADGRQSLCRTRAGIAFRGWPYRQSAVIATVRAENPHHNVAVEAFYPGGPFALLPMHDNQMGLVWSEQHATAKALHQMDEKAFLSALNDRAGDFLGKTELVTPRFIYPLSLKLASSYIGPRLALIGEAAHAMHPVAGQGWNVSMRDVAALAEIIVEYKNLGLDWGGPQALRAYQQWRLPDLMGLSVATDGLIRLFSNHSRILRTVRGVGLSLVQHLPPLRRLSASVAMGVGKKQPKLAQGKPIRIPQG
jgi:2-octaprenyl-6-methoxyphenol hydroxylase